MTRLSFHSQRFVAVIVAVLFGSLALLAVGPAAAQTDSGAVTVDLGPDGSATLSVTYRYDLDGERASAFEDLQGDATAQQATADRFADRVRSIAGDLENDTGRPMSVSDAKAAVSTENGVGIVTLSVTWDGLAAVDGDRVRLAEPFDSGFESDRPLVVELPDGYTATETTPDPAESTAALRWTADQSLSDFSVTAEKTEPTPTSTGGPAVGARGALLALVIVALAATVARSARP